MAGSALVVTTPLEDETGVATTPRPHRVTTRQGGVEHLDPFLAERRGQIIELELVGRREGHRTFDDPLELAHVARPGVCLQRIRRAGREP